MDVVYVPRRIDEEQSAKSEVFDEHLLTSPILDCPAEGLLILTIALVLSLLIREITRQRVQPFGLHLAEEGAEQCRPVGLRRSRLMYRAFITKLDIGFALDGEADYCLSILEACFPVVRPRLSSLLELPVCRRYYISPSRVGRGWREARTRRL